ncbi:MAG TPA: D,D-heptose 1,7-bisphosphate phosphatase, partial [Sutterellaceae bacterium]|nr:D,D-heptose 1,7-bisphosphate phosphatase [Sutterellaceae bacterium]
DIQAAKAAGLSKAVLVQSDGTKPWTECAVPHLQTKDLLAAAKLL